QPDAELAGQVDAGLVRKAHAGGERRGFAVDEIDRLVPFHADAVAGAVRGAGQRIAGAVTPAFVLGAHRIVDAAGRAADLRGGEVVPLALMDLAPDPALVRARLAEHEGARNVGLIAFDVAAAVEQHDLAVAHRLRAAGAVRIGGGLAEQDQRAGPAPAER